MNSSVYINSLLSQYTNIPASIAQEITSQIAPYRNIPYANVPSDVKTKVNDELSPYVDKITSTIANIQAVQQQIDDMLLKAGNIESTISDQLTSLLQYVKFILTSVLDILTNHAGLVSADTRELVDKVVKFLASSLLAVFAGIFAVLLISLLAVVIFWDTHRILAFSIVVCIFVTITAGASMFAVHTAKGMPLVFGQLIAQLKKDRTFVQNFLL